MPGERTEQATQHRRDKARKRRRHAAQPRTVRRGRNPGRRDRAGSAGQPHADRLAGDLRRISRSRQPGPLGAGADSSPHLLRCAGWSLAVLAPPALVMAAVAMAALGVGVLQTGGVNFHVEAIGFKSDRINPVSNIKNLFSLRAAARLAKSLLPASLLAVFAVQRIARQLTIPPFSTARLEMLGSDVYGLLLAAAWLLFGWSAIDYLVEWQSRESRLKMSKQDMRDEFKETEGNPQIRGRIRNLQRQARRRRVKDDVSKAAVVLTNPTHYAVALGFDFATMEAPKVVAKGRNLLAEEIKAEARWAGVPIIENPPLARSFYRSVEVGQPIPVDLYAAVAAILAYLYRQRVEAELRDRRARETPPAPGPGAGRGPVESGRPGAPPIEEVRNEHSSVAVGTLPAQSIWHRLREYVLPLAAISVIFVMLVPLPAAGPGLPAGHLDGRLDHRLPFRDADPPRRRALASFPPCCCC